MRSGTGLLINTFTYFSLWKSRRVTYFDPSPVFRTLYGWSSVVWFLKISSIQVRAVWHLLKDMATFMLYVIVCRTLIQRYRLYSKLSLAHHDQILKWSKLSTPLYFCLTTSQFSPANTLYRFEMSNKCTYSIYSNTLYCCSEWSISH